MATSSNIPNLGIGEVFLKRLDTEEKWEKLVGKTISDSITITTDVQDFDSPACFKFRATVSIGRKNMTRFLQFVGLLKRSRYSYKTIKRSCAKRNRYK